MENTAMENTAMENGAMTSRTDRLDRLVILANKIREYIATFKRGHHDDFFFAGSLLVEAETLLWPGEWQEWVDGTFDTRERFSISTGELIHLMMRGIQRGTDELIMRQRQFVEDGMSPEATLFHSVMYYVGIDRGMTNQAAIKAAEEATGIDRRRAMPEIEGKFSLWSSEHCRPATAPAPDEIGRDGCDLCHRPGHEVPAAPMFRDEVWLRLWDPSSPEAWMWLCDQCVADRAIALGIHLSPADLLKCDFNNDASQFFRYLAERCRRRWSYSRRAERP